MGIRTVLGHKICPADDLGRMRPYNDERVLGFSSKTTTRYLEGPDFMGFNQRRDTLVFLLYRKKKLYSQLFLTLHPGPTTDGPKTSQISNFYPS